MEDDNCPCCNTELVKETRKRHHLVGRECGYCTYLDRPFGSCGNTAETHYGGCSCEYEDGEDYMYISCKNCCKSLEYIKQQIERDNDRMNKKIRFNNQWKQSSLEQKLKTYGIIKLKILAKNKKIKGYSKCKKHELVEMLVPSLSENDFPIRHESST
jgi:hypothetical protein